ncbi:unnamed protein product [Effrenium voratum]|uniref:EF-hand domain-containing protein n=1 Tax=Effrenium voratum TaxID=2562239 RepID=A0AA36N4G4_9DINO|nr:unnamed protein product [Effrenium voratum]CAJ1456345.1 unnamed protein product [Effrenium voratum]
MACPSCGWSELGMPSCKDLMYRALDRHETEMSELAARCEALRLENERRADAPQAPRFAPSERDPIEEGDTSEEAPVDPKESEAPPPFLSSLQHIWSSQEKPQLRKQPSSGLGLKRVLQEGVPRISLLSGASGLNAASNQKLVACIMDWSSWWYSLEEPPRSGWAFRLEQSRCFQHASMGVILANAIWITWLTDWSLQHPHAGVPDEYQYVDYAFMAFFLVEVVLRMVVHRAYFFANDNAGWNVMDLVLVIFSMCEQIISWSAGRDGNGTVLYLRVLRLCKFARVLRSLKVITAFRELAMMMESFRSCLAAMFWSLVLLIFLVFVCALLFAQGVSDGLAAAEVNSEMETVVKDHFGSVSLSMLSLYMAVTGGNDWSLYYWVLQELGSVYHFLFIGYTFFFAFAIFNILTGIFVERAVAASLPDREQQILQERRKLLEQANDLRYLFSCMDLDASGQISLEEFLRCMKDPKIVAYMSSINVSVHDVQYLFKIVANQNDEVDIDRFVDGCMSIKGNASALDMQKQLYYIQELFQTLRDWETTYWPSLMHRMDAHKQTL